jgi:hypothetical protein
MEEFYILPAINAQTPRTHPKLVHHDCCHQVRQKVVSTRNRRVPSDIDDYSINIWNHDIK